MALFDILFVADPRFTGGTSTALANELVAAHRAGFRCALLMVKGPLLRRPYPVHPEIAGLIDAGSVSVVDPDEAVTASLAIIHHPTLFQYLPAKRLRVSAGKIVLVLPHPEVDAAGAVQYHLGEVLANIETAFGRTALLAPAGVNVRRSLRSESIGDHELLAQDWLQFIDLSQWPAADRAPGERIVIGRHSRSDPAKWPDTREEALAVYPDAPQFEIRALGDGVPASYGPLPANWSVQAFRHGGVSEFLRGLDFYVYFHSSAWIEAFGRTILEALASGLVVILPRSFEAQFGSAALYAEPGEVRALVEAVAADPERHRAQSRHARSEVARRFALERFADQVQAVAPDLRPTPEIGVRPQPSARRVLFISSNGIGLGHLSRQMAMARRLPAHVTPIFLTMSHAFKLVLEQGYAGEFVPFHRSLGADPKHWNENLAEEIFAALNFYRPDAVLFDGNNPYPGMLDALATRPEMLKFWVRRAMWRERHEQALLRAAAFDFVIEPGEVAARFDRGPTRAVAQSAYRVSPVCFLDRSELLTRDDAREQLGIPAGSIAVSLQLGSGNNFDLSALRLRVLEDLIRRADVFVVELRSPIRDVDDLDQATGDRHRVVETYPSSRYLNAFDFSVSAVGYNSFHENLMAGLPTIFVPNEAEEMDVQLSRARFAEIAGLGRLLRRQDRHTVIGAIDEMLDGTVRQAIRERCAALPPMTGAAEAAGFIVDSLRYVRTDFDIAESDYRATAPR